MVIFLSIVFIVVLAWLLASKEFQFFLHFGIWPSHNPKQEEKVRGIVETKLCRLALTLYTLENSKQAAMGINFSDLWEIEEKMVATEELFFAAWEAAQEAGFDFSFDYYDFLK